MTGEFSGSASRDQLEADLVIVNRLEAAGWSCAGDFWGDNDVDVGFWRSRGKQNIYAGEAAKRLKLISDSGDLLPGYIMPGHIDRLDWQILYYGPDDERFQLFIEDLINLGVELDP